MNEHVRITGAGHQGDGVARLADGRVVFVPGAFEGDLVEIDAGRLAQGKVARATVFRLVEPSPHRDTPHCGIDACGGCPLRGTQLEWQRTSKLQRVTDALERVGTVPREMIERLSPRVQSAGPTSGYRHRVRLHAEHKSEGWTFGYHARATKNLLPWQGCPVLWPELEASVSRLSAVLRPLPGSAGVRELSLAYSRMDGAAVAHVSAVGLLEHLRHDMSWLEQAGLRGWAATTPDGAFEVGRQTLRYDHAAARHFDLLFKATDFSQANPHVNDLLVELVVGLAGKKDGRVLECHAGIGNFTLPLRRQGVDIIATEASERSVLRLQYNAAGAGLAIEAYPLADTEVAELLPLCSTLLLDPPRTGARALCELVASSGHIERVVYVSCDPATLARDVRSLRDGGFEISFLECLDMFPQTSHIETVALLERQ